MRARLMRDQGRAEDASRFLFHVVDGLDHLDAAGLAAPAGMDLRFHHPHRAAELLRGLERFIDAERRNAARHRDAEVAQHCFGLILVDIHRPSSLVTAVRRWRAAFRHRRTLSAKPGPPADAGDGSVSPLSASRCALDSHFCACPLSENRYPLFRDMRYAPRFGAIFLQAST